MAHTRWCVRRTGYSRVRTQICACGSKFAGYGKGMVISMSVEKMTYMSNFLLVAAGLLGLTAVVLFVMFDIPKCWEMITGKHFAGKEKNSRQKNKLKYMHLSNSAKKLESFKTFDGGEETLLLDKVNIEDTVLLATGESKKRINLSSK